MKRYIIEEKKGNFKTCDGCMYIDADSCTEVRIAPCNKVSEDGSINYVIFVLAKEEEIE